MDYKNKIITNFNSFNGKNLHTLDLFYDQQVHFSDPAKDIQGLSDLKSYYSHVYQNVTSISFDFFNFVTMDKSVVGEWRMKVKARGLNGGAMFEVRGCSVFKFNDQDLVIEHRDYLDLGQMIYEKLPLLGHLISTIKNRL